MREEDFIRSLKEAGYDAPVVVTREPDGQLEEHCHPFEARALILEGDITLRTLGAERTYFAGDVFYLQADEPHAESFGPQGVRYLSGRKGV